MNRASQGLSHAAKRHLVWDFDGTLAWRPGMWRGALAEAAAEQGHVADPEVFHPHLQQGFPWHSPDVTRARVSPEKWWTALHPVLEAALSTCAGLDTRAGARAVRKIFCDPVRWRVFADTVPALEELAARGWRHVILSNHVPELEEIVRGLGLARHFDSVISSGVTGVEKPHPSAFASLRESLGENATLIMIGDSWTADIRGAEAAGWPAILVRNHHPEARHQSANLDELPTMLDAIMETSSRASC